MLSWRKLFIDVANQLAEYEEEDFEIEDQQIDHIADRNKELREAADTEEILKAELSSEGKVLISYQNATLLKVNFYKIDIEVLFSRTPFLLNKSGTGGDFDYIKPNKSYTGIDGEDTSNIHYNIPALKVNQEEGEHKTEFGIPKKLAKGNIFINVCTE